MSCLEVLVMVVAGGALVADVVYGDRLGVGLAVAAVVVFVAVGAAAFGV